MSRWGRGGRRLRIAYGRVFHEANAHSPLATTQSDFERMHRMAGRDLERSAALGGVELQGYLAQAELSGFVQAARIAGGVEAIALASSLAVPGGPLTSACFEWLAEDLLRRIADAGPLDGVYLALHGAMQVEGMSSAPEAVLLERLRQMVGREVKIAVSYDLHGNLSAGLVDPVDVLIAYRTNPHWDMALAGFRAGNRLIRALRGMCRPVNAWRKLPMLLGGGTTIDFLSPMRPVFRWMRHLERNPRVLSASLFMVHPYTSRDDLGWAVHVCCDGDEALAERLADELADRVWAQREVEPPAMRTIHAALDEVAASPWRRLGPVSLVDVDDIVGAGAPGGSTRIVSALLEHDRGLSVYVPVHDPALIEEAWSLEPGARARFTLRGTPGYSQPEVELDAEVAAKRVTDFGRTLRLDVGKVRIAISERPPLPIHPKFWHELGLSPRAADAVVQKNFFHYRMFYAATSFRHLGVISAGATSLADVRRRDFTVPRYPQHPLEDWRPYDPLLRAS
jgi:microcystin degradation protein MlrC